MNSFLHTSFLKKSALGFIFLAALQPLSANWLSSWTNSFNSANIDRNTCFGIGGLALGAAACIYSWKLSTRLAAIEKQKAQKPKSKKISKQKNDPITPLINRIDTLEKDVREIAPKQYQALSTQCNESTKQLTLNLTNLQTQLTTQKSELIALNESLKTFQSEVDTKTIMAKIIALEQQQAHLASKLRTIKSEEFLNKSVLTGYAEQMQQYLDNNSRDIQNIIQHTNAHTRTIAQLVQIVSSPTSSSSSTSSTSTTASSSSSSSSSSSDTHSFGTSVQSVITSSFSAITSPLRYLDNLIKSMSMTDREKDAQEEIRQLYP